MIDLMKGKSKKFQEVFKEFNLMRKTIKKPMTDYAEKLILKKLEQLNNDEDEQIAILENSIMNSWQGVYPLRDDDYYGEDQEWRKYVKEDKKEKMPDFGQGSNTDLDAWSRWIRKKDKNEKRTKEDDPLQEIT